jgi:TPR repeat protein
MIDQSKCAATMAVPEIGPCMTDIRKRTGLPRLLAALAVGMLCLCAAGAATAQDIAREMFDRAGKAEADGKPAEAAKLYEQAAAGGVAEAFGRLGILAAARGAHKTAADWYERGAKACDGTSQLGLALAHRMGQGRDANGDIAYAWLIAAERAKSDWSDSEMERLATLERDIPAYMSSAQISAAYCLGLDFYIDACGGTHLMTRLERWIHCE